MRQGRFIPPTIKGSVQNGQPYDSPKIIRQILGSFFYYSGLSPSGTTVRQPSTCTYYQYTKKIQPGIDTLFHISFSNWSQGWRIHQDAIYDICWLRERQWVWSNCAWNLLVPSWFTLVWSCKAICNNGWKLMSTQNFIIQQSRQQHVH